MRVTRKPSAFSLLELLLVLVIVAIVAAVALGSYSAMAQATALTTGAERLQETLAEARQAAITQNVPMEMRFYATPTAGPVVYRIVQAHALKPDGTIPPLSPPVVLPASVALDATAAHSPLLASNSEVPTADASDKLLNGQTRVFRFLPDGSTDLDPTSEWFVTLRAAGAADPAHFPANWACLALDPVTGRVQIYRP